MKTLQDATQEINLKLGSSLDNIISDGKIQRPEKQTDIWYACNESVYKGNVQYTIIYGNWKIGDEQFIWHSFDKSEFKDKNFLKAYVEKNREFNAKMDLDKQKKWKACAEKWKPIFSSSVSKSHEYLEYKNIKTLYTARVNNNGALLIPMYDHKKLVGVQQIYKDPATGDFEKRFSAGVKKKGSFCHLKPYRTSEFIYLCEGYATACSIQEAFPKIPVICGFDSGNLFHAINSIRFVNPDCKIVIAADNDKKRVGEFAAKKCADAYKDVIYKVAEFPASSPSEWSDFNDVHSFVSLNGVKSQLAVNEEDFFNIKFLGCSDKKGSYYFTSSNNKQLMEYKDNDLKFIAKMFKIAPKKWYEKNFPAKIEEDDAGNKKQSGIAWDDVVNDFTQESLKAGFFNKKNIKGYGIWKDKDEYIFNNGDSIYPNRPINSLENFYNEVQCDDSHFKIEKPLEIEDMRYIWENLKKISLANRESSGYLAAWMIQANLVSVFNKRFHIWITGGTSTGKSWVQEELLEKCIYNCQRSKNASAASIYPIVGDNAVPYIFDESEPDKKGIDEIVRMAREATDADGASKQRTNANQERIEFKAMVAFAFGSVQIPKLEAQDKNRFFFVDIVPQEDSGQKDSDFAEVEEMVVWLRKNKSRLFARCYNRIPQILANEKIAYKRIKELKLFKVTRTSQLTAVLVACLHEFIHDDEIDIETVDTIIDTLNLKDNSYINEAKVEASKECRNLIMNMEISASEQKTLTFCVEHLTKNEEYKNKDNPLNIWIASHGIRILSSTEMFIHSESEKIKKKLKGTGNEDYARVLRRDKEFLVTSSVSKRIAGYSKIPQNGLIIKI